MSIHIANSELVQRLHEAGVFDDDPSWVRRIVIDITMTAPPKVYIERWADALAIVVALESGLTAEPPA